MISDGWKRTPPSRIHRAEPWEATPITMVATISSQATIYRIFEKIAVRW